MFRYLLSVFSLLALAVVARRSACADDGFQVTRDPAGELASVSTNGFDTGDSNGFFANLGTNGRTGGTCHVVENDWTFTPTHAQALAPNDPLFTPTTAPIAHRPARRRARTERGRRRSSTTV